MNILATIFLLMFASLVGCSRDLKRYCAACRVVVDEIEKEIEKVDPNKMLEIESFRVDPNGNQKRKNVLYARSETHLTEVMEELCPKMKDYAESSTPNGDLVYKSTLGGAPVENVSLGGSVIKKLKHMCENIIEDHEEEFMEFFKNKSEDSRNVFCTQITGLCAENEAGREDL